MTVALIASLLLNVLFFCLNHEGWRAARFWRRMFDNEHKLFRGQLHAEHSRRSVEIQDALARIHQKRRAEREWN